MYLFQATNEGKIKSPSLSHSFNQAHSLVRVLYLTQGTSDGLMENTGLLAALTCTVCLHWGQSLLVLSHKCTCACSDFLQNRGYDSPLGVQVAWAIAGAWTCRERQQSTRMKSAGCTAVQTCVKAALLLHCNPERLLSLLIAVSTAVKLVWTKNVTCPFSKQRMLWS